MLSLRVPLSSALPLKILLQLSCSGGAARGSFSAVVFRETPSSSSAAVAQSWTSRCWTWRCQHWRESPSRTWRETRRTGRAPSGRWRWGRRRNEVQSSSSRHRRWRPCVSPVPPDLVASFPSRGHRGRRWLSWTPGPWKCLWSWTSKASVESLL